MQKTILFIIEFKHQKSSYFKLLFIFIFHWWS